MSATTAVVSAISPPPPMPCRARKAISWSSERAAPASTEPVRKMTSAVWKVRLRSCRSLSLPNRTAAAAAVDRRRGGGDDCLVERGDQHGEDQADIDNLDLAVGEGGGGSGGGGGHAGVPPWSWCCCGDGSGS